MEAINPLHLLVVLLCFSSLVSSNAAPITRTRKLMMETQEFAVLEDNHLGKGEESVMMMMSRRMDAEVNDYPWSGANNRHNPTPRPGRACADCN